MTPCFQGAHRGCWIWKEALLQVRAAGLVAVWSKQATMKTILLLQTKTITILIGRFYKVNALLFFFLATAGLVAANCLLHYTDQVFILQKIYHWLSFIPLLRTQLQVHWISDKLTKVISTQLEFNCNNLPFLSYDSANKCPAKSALGGLRWFGVGRSNPTTTWLPAARPSRRC